MPELVAADVAVRIIAGLLESPRSRPPVVLIDGRSGAGKTSLARLIADRVTTARIIRLDDIYPGWHGLESAREHLLASVLEPRAAALPARFRRWDWVADAVGDWVTVDRSAPLIVEGVGSLGARARALTDFAAWIELDDASRKARALDRDGAAFATHWESWAAQEDSLIAREHPTDLADMIVDGHTITG